MGERKRRTAAGSIKPKVITSAELIAMAAALPPLKTKASGRPDTRIPYGARCTWWDSIDKAGLTPERGGHRLPCCPHCRGMLFEMASEQEWNAQIQRYEAAGHPGYSVKMEWARGKCFPSFGALDAAYLSQTERPDV